MVLLCLLSSYSIFYLQLKKQLKKTDICLARVGRRMSEANDEDEKQFWQASKDALTHNRHLIKEEICRILEYIICTSVPDWPTSFLRP